MANGTDYVQLAAHARLGEEVLKLCLASGLVVKRQKPGRKAEKAPRGAKTEKPVKAKPARPVESYDDPADDE